MRDARRWIRALGLAPHAEGGHLREPDRIPAHRRHRVEWTGPGAPTVWLALFIAQEPARIAAPG